MQHFYNQMLYECDKFSVILICLTMLHVKFSISLSPIHQEEIKVKNRCSSIENTITQYKKKNEVNQFKLTSYGLYFPTDGSLCWAMVKMQFYRFTTIFILIKIS